MSNKKILFILIIFFSIYANNTLAYYYRYDDVLVVANNASDISLNITDYFVKQRNISYVVYLDTTTTETINFNTFKNSIRKPIEDYIINNNLQNKINYIVTTKGVPLKISGASEDCSGPKTATQASVDSELTLILGPYNNSIGSSGLVWNPYNYKNEKFNHTKYGIYLVTRLTGYQNDNDADGIPDDIKNLIDSAVNTNKNGIFILDQDPAWGSLGGLNNNMENALNTLTNKGLKSILNKNSTYLTKQSDVLGYVSWGSNDHYDHLYTTNAIPNNTWLNGSLVETYVSNSARSFNWPPIYGQSLIADLIYEGATGAKGYVYEPCASAMANVNILFDRYTDGFNLADSYYMASNYLSWMDVVVGDPKTAAFKNSSNLIIWDETDIDMPYANKTKYPNNETKFFANYTKTKDNNIIIGGSCSIEFKDLSANMDYNSSGFYEFNRNFSKFGTYFYNVTCSKKGFDTLTVNDYVIISPVMSSCEAPVIGNWVVDEACSINNEYYIINGNLTVGSNGFLNLRGNTNIIFNGTNRYIHVEKGGEINIYDSAGFN